MGAFNYAPPVRHAPMPRWSLNILLAYLKSSSFEPLEGKDPYTIKLKTLCLLLLATGRRISEITNLSRYQSRLSKGEGLSLKWVPSFTHKRKGPKFDPNPPSILYIRSDDPEDLLLCPVRAYKIYLEKTPEFHGVRRNIHLWDHGNIQNIPNIPRLSKCFNKIMEI